MSRDAIPALLLTERRLHVDTDEPFHVHLRADESILVVDGVVAVSVDGTRSVLTAGEVTSVPAGAIHSVVPGRGAAVVMLSHRPAEQVVPADLPEDAWPLVDGLGTLVLGADRVASRHDARTPADHGA